MKYGRYIPLAIYVLVAILFFDPKIFVGGDNATYIGLSKSLLSLKYQNVWEIVPSSHKTYPPIFPLIISPLTAVNAPYVCYNILVLLLGAGCVLLTYHLYRSVWVATLLAVSPLFVKFSGLCLSDVPGLLAVLGLLYCHSRNGKLWLLVLLSGCAYYTRTVGMFAVFAVFVDLMFKNRKRGVLYGGICVVMMLPWMLYATSYAEQFVRQSVYQDSAIMGIHGVLGRIPPNLINLWNYWGLLWIPIIVGMRWVSRVELVFVASYLFFILLTPPHTFDPRYLVLTLPIFIHSVVLLVGKLFPVKPAKYVLGGSAGSIFVLSALIFLCLVAIERPKPYPQEWRDFFAGAEAAREMPQDKTFITRKTTLFYLVSKHRASCYPFTNDTIAVRKVIDRADYVMLEPFGTIRYLLPVVGDYRLVGKYGCVYMVTK